ncbi:hypothetical protein ILUMI_19856 [Ignelater luminosus]|uniref:Uncharacterized protein n=1 Tax=Ignelater luminosus TaxID=2038154 RepID=A0A8K0G2T8_IGNLU|nr:hypothetical protein ILUMI_19856 [Ignelater luminosus]
MLGIIRYLKDEIKAKDQAMRELKGQLEQGRAPATSSNTGTALRGYAAAASRPKPATYAVKVTAREMKDASQVQQILRSSVNPGRAQVAVYAVRSAKSGGVIVECGSKKDAEKMKAAVEAYTRLKWAEVAKSNPRVLLKRVDNELRKDKLMAT